MREMERMIDGQKSLIESFLMPLFDDIIDFQETLKGPMFGQIENSRI
jgi:hypothetical protein